MIHWRRPTISPNILLIFIKNIKDEQLSKEKKLPPIIKTTARDKTDHGTSTAGELLQGYEHRTGSEFFDLRMYDSKNLQEVKPHWFIRTQNGYKPAQCRNDDSLVTRLMPPAAS